MEKETADYEKQRKPRRVLVTEEGLPAVSLENLDKPKPHQQRRDARTQGEIENAAVTVNITSII